MLDLGDRTTVSQRWLRRIGLWEEAKRLAGLDDKAQFVVVPIPHPFIDKIQATLLDRLKNKPTSMRTLTDHKLNGLNDALEITVTDEPGHGGACHRYDITGFDTDNNPAATPPSGFKASFTRVPIIFQNGPILEHGINGISQEALLAVVIDRLRSFQAGPFTCRENAVALTHVETALMWLQKRTRDRMARGVEGTSQK